MYLLLPVLSKQKTKKLSGYVKLENTVLPTYIYKVLFNGSPPGTTAHKTRNLMLLSKKGYLCFHPSVSV